ncbi:MAG: M48 family metalloprotease [Clostridium sp.]|nr:M48 family metalloprotease [Clostridium sp.]
MKKISFDKFAKFFDKNAIYIFWSIVNFFLTFFILGANWGSFILCIFIYAISLTIALSPLGEQILRLINGVRRLYTRREKDYLVPLFEEICEDVKEQHPNLPDLEICIIDSLTVNACAMGRHTIAVTRGAVETFTEDELKGVLLHEIGHIVHGDTKATLLNLIGNGLFSIGVIFIKLILLIFDLLLLPLFNETKGITVLITSFIRFIFNILLFAFTLTGNIILSINSRGNEYSADYFAYKMAYGEELISALYLLQKMSLGENMKLVQRMQASHPHIAKRIGRLEHLEDRQ